MLNFIAMDYKHILSETIKIDGITREEIAALLADTSIAGGGDISLPCYRLAAKLKKPPQVLAAEVAAQKLPDFVEKTEAVGPYANFFLKRDLVAHDVLNSVLSPSEGVYGDARVGAGKTVCIDYSSVNIAKQFHIGHLSTTAIGAALYRIYKKLGYNTVGINHLGDWGTQFGKQIVAHKKWGSGSPDGQINGCPSCAYYDKIPSAKPSVTADDMTVDGLQKLYTRFHAEAEHDPSLEVEAREWFKKIETGDPEALRLFDLFKEVTMREVAVMYDRLGVTFDSWLGESFYSDKMQPIIDELIEKKIAVIDDGALIVKLDEYKMPPCLIRKTDGASLYATRDMAAAEYRYKTYTFDKCLYVVAYQQNLHFKQYFKVLELIGKPYAKDLEHVAYGMVSLEEGAMSTRKGNVVLLRDCLDNAAKRALEIINEKNPALADKEAAAEAIGVTAAVFSALYNGRIKDIVFSYEKILNFDGETGPYLMYTAARCHNVLANTQKKPDLKNISGITNDEGYEVVKLLQKYPDTIVAAAKDNEPCYVTRLLMNLAQGFNKFYFDHRIIGSENEESRLALTAATLSVLRDGFNLLGFKFLEKM